MNQRYRIGIDSMDEQHSRIFEIAQRARAENLTNVEIQILIVELLEYAKSHLDAEEKFLEDEGLGDFLHDHIGLHAQFRARAMDIYQQFRDAETQEVRNKILCDTAEFCEKWLLNHIDIEDRKYADLIKVRRS